MRFVGFALVLSMLPATAFAADPIAGNWRTQDGKAVVTIAPCGPALCGKIARILAAEPNGPAIDSRNPDPALRKRPVLGLQILSGFAATSSDWRGKIYSPEEGKTYRSILRRNSDGTLNVKGCIAFFCQGQTWKPVR